MTGNHIVSKLFESFAELRKAIDGAKKSLSEKGVLKGDLSQRLNTYYEILDKQQTLAIKLCKDVQNNDWDEVSRTVSLINGLSGMIRDDARDMLMSINLNSDVRSGNKDEPPFC